MSDKKTTPAPDAAEPAPTLGPLPDAPNPRMFIDRPTDGPGSLIYYSAPEHEAYAAALRERLGEYAFALKLATDSTLVDNLNADLAAEREKSARLEESYQEARGARDDERRRVADLEAQLAEQRSLKEVAEAERDKAREASAAAMLRETALEERLEAAAEVCGAEVALRLRDTQAERVRELEFRIGLCSGSCGFEATPKEPEPEEESDHE